MPSVSVIGDDRRGIQLHFENSSPLTGASIKNLFSARVGVDQRNFYLTRNGRSVNSDDVLANGDVLRVRNLAFIDVL